jgi:hypothetical protein
MANSRACSVGSSRRYRNNPQLDHSLRRGHLLSESLANTLPQSLFCCPERPVDGQLPVKYSLIAKNRGMEFPQNRYSADNSYRVQFKYAVGCTCRDRCGMRRYVSKSSFPSNVGLSCAHRNRGAFDRLSISHAVCLGAVASKTLPLHGSALSGFSLKISNMAISETM